MRFQLSLVTLGLSSAILSQAFAGDIPTFKKKNAKPTGCDIATMVGIERDKPNPDEATITLAERVLGTCEIYVPANERVYSTKVSLDRCGGVYYESAEQALVISDQRRALCADAKKKILTVKEDSVVLGKHTTYSSKHFDAIDVSQTSIVGELGRLSAIGSDTTGYEVGGIEVDFDRHNLTQDAEKLMGTQVSVRGHYEIYNGVESGPRKVLVAEFLEIVYTAY